MVSRRLLATLLIVSAAGLPIAAYAGRPGCEQAFVLQQVPPYTEFAAEVEIVSIPTNGQHWPMQARIISLLRGSYTGTTIILDPGVMTSCDIIPRQGQRGIVGGKIVSSIDGVPTVMPVREMSMYERDRNRTIDPSLIFTQPLNIPAP